VAPPGVAAPTLDVPHDTLSAWIDRAVFGSHLWKQSLTWDPEGLLSTLPAIATCLLGVLAGRWLAAKVALADRLNGLFCRGRTRRGGGPGLERGLPHQQESVDQLLRLVHGGAGCLSLATCAWLIDVRAMRRWAAPLVSYGKNPMVAFVGSGLMARLLGMIHVAWGGETMSLQQAIYRGVFASWLTPRNASLGYAIGFVAVWYGILRLLEKRGVMFRV
jgi:predicted acyltransferase